MTADKARELSDENSRIPITHTLASIYQMIENEAKKGCLNIGFDGNISETSAKNLQDNGFHVEFNRYPTKDNIYGLKTFISWQVY